MWIKGWLSSALFNIDKTLKQGCIKSCMNSYPCAYRVFTRSFLKSLQIFSSPRDISNKFFIGLSEGFSFPINTSKSLPWSAMKWPHCAGHQGFHGCISACALNCKFQIQTAKGPRPWAASAAEALCCFTHFKLTDMFKFALPLLNPCATMLQRPCKVKWLKTYMCQGNEVLPSLILVCISWTAICAHFNEIYSIHRGVVRHISM